MWTALSPKSWEQRRDEYTVTTDPARLDLDVIHGYLTHAYWCEGISRETVERSLQHSMCFGLFAGQRQIGFARVISDRATFAYLCDVFVLEEWQGSGLGTWLMQCVMAHPDLQGLRRWHLVTRDAHPLYRKVGFTPLGHSERHMEGFKPNIYKY
jgi:GNAT superfamily N-acetyltransferase